MSLVFSNTATTGNNGILQEIELECGFNPGDITGNAVLLKQFTTAVNQAMDDFWNIAIPASGTWQLEDSNNTDLPILTANLVSGQRDYSFTSDSSSNLILDIYKVDILPSSTATQYQEIYPSDEVSYDSDIITATTATGVPNTYGKLGNSLILEPKPNYSATAGIKMVVNREGSYFATTDTTKKPGVSGILHRYFVVKPSLAYARRKTLANYNRLLEEVISFEGRPGTAVTGMIATYYSKRQKDSSPVMENESIIYQ